MDLTFTRCHNTEYTFKLQYLDILIQYSFKYQITTAISLYYSIFYIYKIDIDIDMNMNLFVQWMEY